MKILTIVGSSDPRGTTVKINSLLCDRLSSQYPEAKIVTRQAFPTSIRPCTNCGACKRKGKCTLRDEFEVWIRDLCDADLVFLVFPVYFFGIPAQLKAFIDRFHGCTDKLREANTNIASVIISADTDPHVKDSIVIQLKQIGDYLNWNQLPNLWLGGLLRAGNVNEDTEGLMDRWFGEIAETMPRDMADDMKE